jgi:hypothetical protein
LPVLSGNMLCGVEVGRYMFRVGKPMRVFVWVQAAHADGKELKQWIALAELYVGTLPPK